MGRGNKRESNKSFDKTLASLRNKYNPKNQRGFTPKSREMHKAKCSECRKECQVPFVPKEGKPVYCRDCFRQKRKW